MRGWRPAYRLEAMQAARDGKHGYAGTVSTTSATVGPV